MRVPLAVEKDKATNPIDVAVGRLRTTIARKRGLPKLIQ